MLYFFIHDKKKRFQLDYLSIGKYCALGLFFLLRNMSSRAVLLISTSYFLRLSMVEFYVNLYEIFFSSKGNFKVFLKIVTRGLIENLSPR